MIVILGLVVLVAALIAGVAGVLANGGHAHAVTHFAVFGQPGSRRTAGAPGRPGRRGPSRRVRARGLTHP